MRPWRRLSEREKGLQMEAWRGPWEVPSISVSLSNLWNPWFTLHEPHSWVREKELPENASKWTFPGEARSEWGFTPLLKAWTHLPRTSSKSWRVCCQTQHARAGNRSGSSLAAWVVWSHDWEPSVHINHNSSTLGRGNELREMPCVIKSETDWHSNKISSPTLCTLLGPWRGVYTRNSIAVTSYSWFRTTPALLSHHGQRAALIDVKLACSTWYCLLLLLMVTDRYQGTVCRECAALKTQRETNLFNAAKSLRLRQQIMTLTFLRTGADGKVKDGQVFYLLLGDLGSTPFWCQFILWPRDLCLSSDFLQALRVKEPMMVLFGGEERGLKGPSPGFWRKGCQCWKTAKIVFDRVEYILYSVSCLWYSEQKSACSFLSPTPMIK